MNITPEQIRGYRLRVHHLNQRAPAADLVDVAGVCGLQNSPPGAWETAAFVRLEGCTLHMLHSALYQEKCLLQAWSFRGAPVVFPTSQSDVFLTALTAQEGEQPWIYTMGITAALDWMQMSFDELLLRTKKAALSLNGRTIKRKEALDAALAELVHDDLPQEKRALWGAPSMYGHPDRQTVGGAVVSFLLRPCSFSGLVVFGERQGVYPTFTSFETWTGRRPEHRPQAGQTLARQFLHAYGPATVDSFQRWLGSSRQQARRLWDSISDERTPVSVGNTTQYLLSSDLDDLLSGGAEEERLMLLGAHDPYLDIRDRAVILEDPALQRTVWKTVANPGAILKGGRIVGVWQTKTQKNKLDCTMHLFEALEDGAHRRLKLCAEEYAAFRLLELRSCQVNPAP